MYRSSEIFEYNNELEIVSLSLVIRGKGGGVEDFRKDQGLRNPFCEHAWTEGKGAHTELRLWSSSSSHPTVTNEAWYCALHSVWLCISLIPSPHSKGTTACGMSSAVKIVTWVMHN